MNEGSQSEWKVNVKGAAPITVAWYRNEVKLKSSRTHKMTFVRGLAKLLIFEASADDACEFRVEATNKFGTASLTAQLDVIGEALKLFYQLLK